MSIEVVPVYDKASNRILHYVVRTELSVGCFLYLLSVTRLIESDVLYELIWTNLQKDANQYVNSEAQQIADELNLNINSSSISPNKRKWEEYDDTIDVFETLGHAIQRRYWESDKRRPR